MNCVPTLSSLVTSALFATGCVEFPAGIKQCRDGPADLRINERGDQDELTSHPFAAAALGNGRVLVAFTAQTIDDATSELLASEVRIALVDQATGNRLTLCNTGNRDRTLSDPGAIAVGGSVAPVELTILGNKAVALVAWTQGLSLPNSVVQMRFIDGAGCPLAANFRPYTGPAIASSLAWSDHHHAVLATLHDERNVYRAWVDAMGPAETVPIAAAQGFIYGFPVNAVASGGNAVVAWGEPAGARGMLLDADGNPRAAAAGGGQATGFPIELPLIAQDVQVVFTLAVAARDDRFAVAAAQRTVNRAVSSRVMVREYAQDGAAIGPAYPLDVSDSSAQGSPTVAYAPGGTLVAIWESIEAGGTVGRLFDAAGQARFNSITCDDGHFPIGTRTESQFGYPSLLISNGRVIVFHNALGGTDPRGSSTLMWKEQYEDIWPGPR